MDIKIRKGIKPGEDWKILVKKETESYKETYSGADYDLCDVLSELVHRYTTRIYNDKDRLEKELKKYGVRETDILKVCLMTKVNGFGYLLHTGEQLQRAELECCIRNAAEETGFTRETIMELVRAVALSAGSAVDYNGEHLRDPSHAGMEERAYMIPVSLYEEELEKFDEGYHNNSTKDLDYSRLEPLAAAGIIKAKFHLGYCLLHKSGLEMDSEKGLELLTEAADLGDSEACAVLGDYYFDQGPGSWEQAYRYYTGYGAMALNEDRRKNIERIFKQVTFNGQLINTSLLQAGIMAAMLFLPGMAMSLPCLAGTGLLVLIFVSALWYKHHCPYGDLRFAPACMFLTWAACFAADRIL